jgi:hypothetical protein
MLGTRGGYLLSPYFFANTGRDWAMALLDVAVKNTRVKLASHKLEATAGFTRDICPICRF